MASLWVDLFMLPLYPLWFIASGRFIIYTPLLEMPHRQAETVLLSVWFLGLVWHAAICYRDNRAPVILQFFERLSYAVRDYVLQCLVGTFVWDFLKFIHLPTVCIVANLTFEICFLVCTVLAAGVVFHLSICNEDEKFYLHNLVFLSVYCAMRVRCRDLYDVERLVVHFAYACLHLGCLGEHLDYPGSYYAINVGIVIFILRVLWYLLNFGHPSDVAGGGVDPSDDAPTPNLPLLCLPDDEARPGRDPPSDSSPDKGVPPEAPRTATRSGAPPRPNPKYHRRKSKH